MEYAARAVTPTSSEAETDQESDVEEQYIDSWPSETDSPATGSPFQQGHNSPSLEPASVSSAHCEGTGEETKDAYVALDVKEESQSPPCDSSPDGGGIPRLSEQDDAKAEKENACKQLANKQIEHDHDTDLEKALHESQGKRVADEEDEGECRICHLVFDGESAAGETMELGCDCKDDLSLAHRHCAEAWFKIKGNRTCEICGATAQNVVGMEDTSFIDQWNDRDASSSTVAESARCWQSQPLCNFLLGCMVVAFILPWLFRVTIF